MQPVEINAGSWYLRALRADDRLSDVPALADLGLTADVVTATDRAWTAQTACTWAVCEPTTGELVALISVAAPTPSSAAQLTGQARAGGEGALAAAEGPVGRFVADALGWSLPD
ncbi:MAG: hypothetical protein WAW85_13670 [Gordonia sp. (in: high G+C Gram-positive bacteria)]|uniref:hypothetical protein n=1 Tax=Gordonia sp. (in: high G+C Gram-positive bacteria) TaxID=84139 RepID=UPI003BB6CD82